MKTYRPILFVLLFAIAGVTLFIWSSWLDRKRAEDSQYWVSHTNNVLKELGNVRILALSRESSIRGFVVTGNTVFIDSLAAQRAAIDASMQEATRLLIDNAEQLARLKQVAHLLEEKMDFQQQVVQARMAGLPEYQKLVSNLKGKTLMDQASAILAVMNVEENKLLQARTDQYHVAGRKSLETSIIGALAVLVFTAILLLRLNRDIQLRRKAEEEVQKSEAKYRQFIENAGVITYTADASGNFTFISNQVQSLIGYAPDELLGKHFSILVQPDWIPIVTEKYKQQFLDRQRESTLLFPVNHKNGETRWVEQDVILLEKDNYVQGFQCVVKDVTEQTFIQQKLQKVEEEQKEYQYRAQAILDNAPLVIYVKDLDGKFILINRMFRELFGFTDEEVIGKESFGFAHQTTPTLKRYAEADRQVIETGKPVELEDIMVVADGHRHLLSIKFPLYDKNNKLLGVSGFMKDVTDMVKYRQELIAARQKAESAETLQEQFLANMSHEIRTPMNGIVGMTGLLMQSSLQEHQREYVNIIKQSSDNLLVLINDILDLSKIKAGKISIEKIAFSLDDVVKPLNAAFRLKAAEKELGFSILLHPSVPPNLLGDPHRLSQVLGNLLSNAMKFTEKGYVTLEISVQEQNTKRPTLAFLVSDSGIGIDEKQLPLIFESFSQASSDTTRRFGGTGLGLAISKRLIELQHGSIHVASKPGSGTTFTVLLPFMISTEEEVMKGKVKPLSQPDIALDFTGKHVLIVEDNEVNQRVLQYNLEQYNITVTIAGNGKEAIHWLRKNNTDLIMMDLHMPQMDGLQATDYIRRQMKSTIPIVILTASVLRNERQRCLNIGANDYIAKPFAREELQRCLERFLLHRDTMPTDHQPQSSIPIEDGNPVYDLSALLQLKDAGAIKAIYEVFENTVPTNLEDLKQMAIEENWQEVFELAHKLKSSLGIIQVKDLLSKMAAIEMNARTRKQLREILPLINESIATFYHVSPMIKLEIEKEIA